MSIFIPKKVYMVGMYPNQPQIFSFQLMFGFTLIPTKLVMIRIYLGMKDDDDVNNEQKKTNYNNDNKSFKKKIHIKT